MNLSHRFPRRLIISKPGLFKEVRDKGFHRRGELMDIYARRSEKVTSTFGFTTSRQLKKAVERNRARRLMKEAVRLNRHRIAEGWEIILAWRVGIKDVGYIQAEKEILTLLEKFGILQITSQEGGL